MMEISLFNEREEQTINDFVMTFAGSLLLIHFLLTG